MKNFEDFSPIYVELANGIFNSRHDYQIWENVWDTTTDTKRAIVYEICNSKNH
jgi:hypothetical protein